MPSKSFHVWSEQIPEQRHHLTEMASASLGHSGETSRGLHHRLTEYDTL